MGTPRNKRMQENIAEEVYIKLDEHMQKALSFHEQRRLFLFSWVTRIQKKVRMSVYG